MSLSVLRAMAEVLRRAPREADPVALTRALAPRRARLVVVEAPGTKSAPSTPSPQHRLARRARLAVVLVPVAFVFALLSSWAVAETVTPEITDTDYHIRLRMIRTAAAEHPGRPLGLTLGSSRTVWAFRPEELPESPDSNDVYWLNAAHVGAGPPLNRVLLHRLLRDGVRPAVVVLEVMPPFFVKENNRFVTAHFATSDMSLVRQYSDTTFGYDYHFLRHRITRATDIARVTDPFAGYLAPLPRGGHPHIDDTISAEERARRTAFAHRMNIQNIQNMTVRPGADRAFRDTLREAADHGIRVVLLRSPEGPAFRSWYNPEGLARFDAYIAQVAREHGAAVLDARLWLDEEDFYDSHHVLKRGAQKFTARFAREMPALLTR